MGKVLPFKRPNKQMGYTLTEVFLINGLTCLAMYMAGVILVVCNYIKRWWHMADFAKRKETFKANPDRLNLLYQWVQDKLVSFKQFKELLEYHYELQAKAISDDTFD